MITLLAAPVLTASIVAPSFAAAVFGAIFLFGCVLMVASVVQWARGRNER